MKKILITGGAGFIGYHLTKSLYKNNKLFLFDNLERGQKDKSLKNMLNKNVKFINKDLTKPINLKIKNISWVFHLAAKVGVKNVIESPLKTLETNTLSLVNTINFLKKNNFKGRFVFFSTSEVYSPLIFKKLAKQPISEIKDLIIPRDVKSRDSYYLSKIFGEKLVQLSGFNYNIVRPHNIYGPRMGSSHVIPELIKKISNKNKATIQSPSHKRAFCFIDDAVKQILKITKSDKKNTTFNIGNPTEEIKMLELAKKIKLLINSKSLLLNGKITLGSPPRRVPSIQKLVKIANFTNLDFGLRKTIEWYLKK
jgi:UDP-glucose 4-epimerase